MPDVVISFLCLNEMCISAQFYTEMFLIIISTFCLILKSYFYKFYFLRYTSTLRLVRKFTCLLLQDTQTNSNLYSTTLHIYVPLWKDSKRTKYFNKMHSLSFQVKRIRRVEKILFGGRKCRKLLRMAIGKCSFLVADQREG